jgi:AbrB family looped-hinge helix DNA binding protein
MKYTSKVNYANKNNTTLKTVIPSEIAETIGISANDTLKWTIKEDNTIIIEKLIL